MFYIQLASWTFNLIMAGVGLLGLYIISRSQTRRVVLAAVTLSVVTAIVLMTLLMREPFLGMRLASFALFIHLPCLLIGSIWLLYRKYPRFCLILSSLAGMILAVAIDAFIIEPRWLQDTNYVIQSPKVTKPLTLVLVADLQTDHIGNYERAALKRVMDKRPDVILMAGDYVQTLTTETFESTSSELRDYLQEIQWSAPLGVFAVAGNTDHPRWQSIFDGLPVTLISDTQAYDTGELRVTGLRVLDSFWPKHVVPPADKFHVVLGHGPDYARGEIQADLLVAGHTHGGQVRLPFYGPLIKGSNIPRSWTAGRTELSENRTLIVSKGIGMERLAAPRLRFLCRPEIVTIQVLPVDDEANPAANE